MKLIKTNDGLMAWKINDTISWYSSINELSNAGVRLLASSSFSHVDANYFAQEVDFALETMRKLNHSVAEFGVYGSFIFSKSE